MPARLRLDNKRESYFALSLIDHFFKSFERHAPLWEFQVKMLYLIGLGLADETDITVKGLEIVKKAERVYLEAYTSILLVNKEKLVNALSSTQALVLTSHRKLTQGRNPSMGAPSSSPIVNLLKATPTTS